MSGPPLHSKMNLIWSKSVLLLCKNRDHMIAFSKSSFHTWVFNLGQTTVFVGSIFSILILTSNLDTVYPGSPKNTFRLKKFQDLVPQIAPWSFSKIFDKNVALSSTGPKTLKYHRIFKCHTISESYWIALWDRVMKSGVTWSTNEKGAFEDWKLKPP